MTSGKIERYNGLTTELANEFGLSRPTIIKYLENHYDKQICVDVRLRAVEKFHQHINKAKDLNDDSIQYLAHCQQIEIRVPVYYIKGSKRFGAFTGFTSNRIHEQWRREGLSHIVDNAGNFLYRTDNIVAFIEKKWINVKSQWRGGSKCLSLFDERDNKLSRTDPSKRGL